MFGFAVVFILCLAVFILVLFRNVSRAEIGSKGSNQEPRPYIAEFTASPEPVPVVSPQALPAVSPKPVDASPLFNTAISVNPREIDSEIYLDIETLRLSSEVPGGWSSIDKFGIAVAVTWDLQGQFRAWFEDDVSELVAELKRFERIVTYNGERFDFTVLSGYTSTRGLPTRSFDVLVHLTQTIGYRVKLDDVAFHTLGVGKNGDGLEAVRLWREGKKDAVIDYCKNDVELLMRVVAHAREHGFIKVKGKRIPVDWSPLRHSLTRRASTQKSLAKGAGSRS
ncbi:MAG TPA: ribonuclease H-like domain-containing protein [Candidatus Saccharimonadales bacterium]|nr:ribonuclease H-like domain-containing protein [Candidatus Saccharimonadales bacterium]